MNAHEADDLDDQYTSLLAACDDALLAGQPPAAVPASGAALPPRLGQDLACAELLRQVLRPAAGQLPWSQLGRFQLVRELGRGGCGIVYLAFDPVLGREVALKVPRAELGVSPEAGERFQREARAAAGLSHPHIVPVHEAGAVGPVCYIVSAYCPGLTLAAWLKQRTEPLPCAGAADLVATLAEAVQHAHERGVVHRDLKPGNVLMHLESGGQLQSAVPKIADFGMAKFLEERDGADLTRTGAIVGTIGYMAPEQAAGKTSSIGPPADIYGLGAILYELLTRRCPFHGQSELDTLDQVRSSDPVPPSRLRAGIPRALQTICLKALAKVPRARYASAGAMADDLRRFARGEPILARPPGRLQRMLLWARRHPAAAALVLLGGLALMASSALVVGVWYHGAVTAALAQTREALAAEEAQRQAAETAQAEAKVALARARASDYRHAILAAQSAWRSSHVGRAEELLDACPLDLRHWEWHYLKRLCHADRLTLRAHQQAVTGVAVSPDGLTYASSSVDGTVKVWDASTGKVLVTATGHAGPVTGVAFSQDGSRLVSTSRDRTARVWDAATGGLLQTCVLPFVGAGVSFSTDGQRLAAACGGGGINREQASVIVCDVATGKEQFALKAGLGGAAGVAFSPDGTLLAGAGWYRAVLIWDAASGQLRFTLQGHTDKVACVAFSPDGKHLASASFDRTVRIWDLAARKEIACLRGHATFVNSVAFSADGKQLASASHDQSVKVWDVATGQETVTLRGHTDFVFGVRFAPGGSVVSAGADGNIKVWQATLQEARSLRQQSHAIRSLAYSPDGRWLAEGSDNSRMTILDAATGATVLTLPGHEDSVYGVSFSRAGRLASAGRDQLVRVWDLTHQPGLPPSPSLVLRGHADRVVAVAFSPDGTQLVSASYDGTVRVWDASSGRELSKLDGANKNLTGVAFHPDGRQVATAGVDWTVRTWDLTTGASSILGRHDNVINGVAYSPDGNYLASAGHDRVARLWNLRTGATLVLRGHAMPLCAVAFTPDSQRLASASADQSVKLWDVASGQEVLTLEGGAMLRALCFSPDGQHLATGGEDGSTKLWTIR